MSLTSGIFRAILERGPRAFLIGKISDVNLKLGKFHNIQNRKYFALTSQNEVNSDT